MTDLSPMARVTTQSILAKVDPFLEHFDKRKAEYDRALATCRATSTSRWGKLLDDRLGHRVSRAREIANICKHSADGLVMISSPDLLQVEWLDPADVDIAIQNLSQQAQDNDEKLQAWRRELAEMQHKRVRRRFIVAVVAASVVLGSALVTLRTMGAI